MNILVVEDEPKAGNYLLNGLQELGYSVSLARDGADGLHLALEHSFDVIVLDVMMPKMDGWEVLRRLRKEADTPVLFLTARDDIADRIKGLELGADDYLIKPFHIAELTARVKSILRRKTLNGKNELEIKNVKIQFDDRVAFINNEVLSLNRKEFDVLAYFMVNKNRLINKTSLAEHVWGDFTDESDDFEFIYSQIKNLRKKLKDHKAEIEIQAVYGIGYKLIAL